MKQIIREDEIAKIREMVSKNYSLSIIAEVMHLTPTQAEKVIKRLKKL
jgi:hypothetical protein